MDKSITQMRDRQRRVFRIACDPVRYGLTLKLIAADAGLGYDSVRAYAHGETTMPITALFALIDVIPDELLSHLMPVDRMIVRVPEGIDFDEAARGMHRFLAAKSEAHCPESECGEAIGPKEAETLGGHLSAVRVGA